MDFFKHHASFQSDRVSRFSWRIREKIFETFKKEISPISITTVLDVGAKTDAAQGEIEGNYFEKMHPFPARITGLTFNPPNETLKKEFPECSFVQGDGRHLQFSDKSFDVVFSSSVIEHVGYADDQLQFVKEACRVGKSVFIITPNRYFPIEVHCRLPFIQYFPLPILWFILKSIGLSKIKDGDILRPIGAREFRRFFNPSLKVKILSIGSWGLPLYLVAIVKPK